MIAEDEGTSSPEGYFAGMFLRRREKFVFFYFGPPLPPQLTHAIFNWSPPPHGCITGMCSRRFWCRCLPCLSGLVGSGRTEYNCRYG